MDRPASRRVTPPAVTSSLAAADLLLRVARAGRRVRWRFQHRHWSVDSLTRLGTRAALAALASELGPGAPPRALLLLDLDGFKRVNDTLGHLAGDDVLQEVARRITAALGPDDLAVRLGGDEFALLTGPLSPQHADDEATLLAEAVLASLSAPLAVDGLTVPVGASIGVAVHGTDGTGLEELLRAADQAMYVAKEAAKDVARGAGSTHEGSAPTRTAGADPAAGGSTPGGRWRRVVHPRRAGGADMTAALVAELRQGLSADQLTLHHQPQVSWDGRVVGFEALLRWHHPEHGLLSPQQFLPAAERAGLLSSVTETALRRAVGALPTLQVVGADVTISVNVPARDLMRDDFLPTLLDLLSSEIQPHRLILEISEPTPFPVPTVARLFRGLSELGVGISIHEFGAGQSSLTALSHYPGLREIKVDPTLVRQVADNEATFRLVRAIISAAHGFEVEVVAEGVEDAPTVRRLRDLGCDLLQGFWVAPPLPLEDVAGWHDRWSTVRAVALDP